MTDKALSSLTEVATVADADLIYVVISGNSRKIQAGNLFAGALASAAAEATIEAAIDTLANLTSVQGLPITLADAGANAFWGWDDTAGGYENLTKGEAQAILGLPTSSTDNVVPRFDGTGGNLQSSNVMIDDSGGAMKPTSSDALALGTASLMWGDLFLASGAVINFNASDVTITHAANVLTFAGATSGYFFDITIAPTATDGAALGATGFQWADLFLAEGGVINWDNGDVTITQTGNVLSFAGAATRYEFDANLTPSSSDGSALGTTALMFSDLFLASGGVINWNSGDVTLTHSANLLAFAGAASGYTFDNLLITGHTASLSVNSLAANMQLYGTTNATSAFTIGLFDSTAADYPRIQFYRSKNASIGSATVVASGDVLGGIGWFGAQQTGTFATQTRAAQIRAEVDGTVTSGGSGDMPGRLIFATTADSGSDVTDRLILDSSGVLKPATNDGLALGNTSLMWSDLFLASGAVINFNNGDVTLTHAANLMAWAGASSGYTYDNLLIVGHTASLSVGGNADNKQLWGTTAATGGMSLGMFSATAGTGAHLDFYRSKDGTIATATVVASGDVLGNINWYGAQQTGTFATQTMAAQIRAEVDGTVTSGAGGDMPGRLVFATTADAGSAVTDRLILDSAGVLKPNANDGVALGTASLSYADLFLASGAVINFANGDVTLTHSSDLLTIAGGGLSIGSFLNLTEIASPASPAADNLRLFAKDVAGATHLFTRDSAGTEVDLSAGGGGGASAATQAEMEAASSTSTYVSPGRQHFHPGHPKCWAFVTVSGGTPTLTTNYNITSIADTATGQLTVTIATDFADANWCGVTGADVAAGAVRMVFQESKAAGTVLLAAYGTAFTLVDPTAWNLTGLGDHA